MRVDRHVGHNDAWHSKAWQGTRGGGYCAPMRRECRSLPGTQCAKEFASEVHSL
jgi:hypothetical protein